MNARGLFFWGLVALLVALVIVSSPGIPPSALWYRAPHLRVVLAVFAAWKAAVVVAFALSLWLLGSQPAPRT
jgi:hypothetical protein